MVRGWWSAISSILSWSGLGGQPLTSSSRDQGLLVNHQHHRAVISELLVSTTPYHKVVHIKKCWPYIAVVKSCFKINIFSSQAHENKIITNPPTLARVYRHKKVLSRTNAIGLIMHDISSPWSGVGGQLLAASRCGQGLVVSDEHHQAVMRGQRENAERKHREKTQKHREKTHRQKTHGQKTQRENTERKHREKTQREKNTERKKHREKKTQREKHADRTHRQKTQRENTQRKHRDRKHRQKNTDRKHREETQREITPTENTQRKQTENTDKKTQTENTERKHTEKTDRKHREKNTDRKHREKTQRENTDRKHRQKTHRQKTETHREKTQTEVRHNTTEYYTILLHTTKHHMLRLRTIQCYTVLHVGARKRAQDLLLPRL